MEITYQLTEEDHREFVQFHRKTSPEYTLRSRAMRWLPAVAVVALGCFIRLTNGDWLGAVIVVVCSIALFAAYPPSYRPNSVRAFEFPNEPNSLKVEKYGLVVGTDIPRYLVRWSKVQRIIAAERHVYFYVDGPTVLIVPHAAFGTTQDCEQFVTQSREFHAADSEAQALISRSGIKKFAWWRKLLPSKDRLRFKRHSKSEIFTNPLALGTGRPTFAKSAYQTLDRAREEASLLDQHFINTEHLLLGLLQDKQSLAVQTLSKMGIPVEELYVEMRRRIIAFDVQAVPDFEIFPRVMKVTELAYEEARALKHETVGAEHILLALIREREGFAGRLLAKFRVDMKEGRNMVQYLHSSSHLLRASSEPAIAPDLLLRPAETLSMTDPDELLRSAEAVVASDRSALPEKSSLESADSATN